MARLARVVVAGIARHVAQRDRKSACEHDDAGNRTSVIDGGGTTPYVANALNQYTSANGTYYQYDTSGNMIYDGHYVFDYDPENRLNKVKRFEQGPTAMALACDTTLTFTTGGDAQWFTQTQEHYFEGDAAQSGDIADSQQSWMQATVSGTGYISFYWKVSSDGSGDYLRFYIDDQLKEEHGGVAGWNQSTKYYVSTGGSHTLKWVYIKNSTGSGGSDCAWVDKIVWEVPVSIGVDKGVDSLLSYTSGGNSTWSYVTSGYYGGDSAKSGQISDEEETWMQTTVTGPGTFKFWWKVSSESGADYLEFYIDNQLQSGSISGATSWAEKSYNITGTGQHTLRWRYCKNGSESGGEDCGWVDHVQWSEPIAEPPTDAWSTLTYTYDASGRRIEKRYDDTLVLKYLYDGDHCIAEYDASNNLRRRYIFGPAVDEPICMIEAGESNAPYYYHFDALGSVVALTDGSGDSVQVYEYDVYGRVGATDPDHSNRFLFTGREFDKETGLYYYRARYYNAEIGRFLQTDPIGYEEGMNLYRYCDNSACNRIDPSGLRVYNGNDPEDRYRASKEVIDGNGPVIVCFTKQINQYQEWEVHPWSDWGPWIGLTLPGGLGGTPGNMTTVRTRAREQYRFLFDVTEFKYWCEKWWLSNHVVVETVLFEYIIKASAGPKKCEYRRQFQHQTVRHWMGRIYARGRLITNTPTSWRECIVTITLPSGLGGDA